MVSSRRVDDPNPNLRFYIGSTDFFVGFISMQRPWVGITNKNKGSLSYTDPAWIVKVTFQGSLVKVPCQFIKNTFAIKKRLFHKIALLSMCLVTSEIFAYFTVKHISNIRSRRIVRYLDLSQMSHLDVFFASHLRYQIQFCTSGLIVQFLFTGVNVMHMLETASGVI